MEKDTQTQKNNIPPDSKPITGQPGQKNPSITRVKIEKKQLIPKIIITYGEQCITIQYAKSPITNEAVTRILHWVEVQTGRQYAYMIPETEVPLLIFLHGVRDTGKPHKDIPFENILPETAFNKIIQQLANTYINSVKTIIVKEGEGKDSIIEAQQQAELAQKFIYEDVSKIPPGVDPRQLDFLHDAASVGAFKWVRDYTAEMITTYFTSEATQIDLGKEYGITKQAVQERITRGMSKMRRVLYRDKPEFAKEDKYPLEQIQKGKDETEIRKTERYKKKLSQAIKDGLRKPSPEKIKKPVIEIFSTELDEH